MKKKLFILDTNVILHDSSCIYQFQENDIIVPMTVIEEIDKFKKGNSSVNFHAREFIRTLDELSAAELFNGGASLGENKGKLSIKLPTEYSEKVRELYKTDDPDNRILNLSYVLSQVCKKTVVLVTKDVNLRLKAQSLKLQAADYTNDQVELTQVRKTVTKKDVEPEIIDSLYRGDTIPAACFEDVKQNTFLILKSNQKSALAFNDANKGVITVVRQVPIANIESKNAEQTFAMSALANKDLQLITITGKAGTGKTLLALAAAIALRSQYRQILLTRPLVSLSNQDIGFLPGDIESKINPYMQPLFDNLGVIKDTSAEMRKQIDKMVEERKIIIEPLTYIRGRSLIRKYLIIDEAQNLTPHEAKTIITRAGEGTRVILTGDIYQIDHPYLDRYTNGLSHVINRMKDQPFYAHVNLEKSERSELADIAAQLL